MLEAGSIAFPVDDRRSRPLRRRTVDRAPESQSAHSQLRIATDAVHRELHRLPIFQRLLAGRLCMSSYQKLLQRMWGFHAPFEAAWGLERRRSDMLADDLRSLGMDAGEIARLPLCVIVRGIETPAAHFGARYVIEGSALGGQLIARALDGLLGAESVAGRQFFLGDGKQAGARWRSFVSKLEEALQTPESRRDAIASAKQTFAIFGCWLDGSE